MSPKGDGVDSGGELDDGVEHPGEHHGGVLRNEGGPQTSGSEIRARSRQTRGKPTWNGEIGSPGRSGRSLTWLGQAITIMARSTLWSSFLCQSACTWTSTRA